MSNLSPQSGGIARFRNPSCRRRRGGLPHRWTFACVMMLGGCGAAIVLQQSAKHNVSNLNAHDLAGEWKGDISTAGRVRLDATLHLNASDSRINANMQVSCAGLIVRDYRFSLQLNPVTCELKLIDPHAQLRSVTAIFNPGSQQINGDAVDASGIQVHFNFVRIDKPR